MLQKIFAPRPATLAGRQLFAAALAQARRPELYAALGAPDTPEGRFELYTLHVVLLLHRLKGQGEQASETAQALFDAFVRNLDEGLREMGVGDLSMGKKMRRLGEAFYGRVKGYDQAFAALPDRAALEALIGRTIYAGAADGRAEALADYAARAVAALAAQPLENVVQARPTWPEPCDA